MYHNDQFTHSVMSLMKKITKEREANKEMIKKKESIEGRGVGVNRETTLTFPRESVINDERG